MGVAEALKNGELDQGCQGASAGCENQVLGDDVKSHWKLIRIGTGNPVLYRMKLLACFMLCTSSKLCPSLGAVMCHHGSRFLFPPHVTCLFLFHQPAPK